MFLIEFDNTEPLVDSIVVAVDQLKSDLEKSEIDFDWDVETLLKYFQKYDIILDRSDLEEMVKKPPLNKVVKNIQGDKVIFKGQQDDKLTAAGSPNKDAKKTVSQMAKKALKRK